MAEIGIYLTSPRKVKGKSLLVEFFRVQLAAIGVQSESRSDPHVLYVRLSDDEETAEEQLAAIAQATKKDW